ncbi:hypothetical protein [Paraburkholderia jirisanensis]
MKLIFDVSSKIKISFAENGEMVDFLVCRGGVEKKITLHNEVRLLCGKNGILFVSDGHEILRVHDGLAERAYSAVYKISDLVDIAGAALAVDENILILIAENGELVWQYWHIDPIAKITVHDEFIEFTDENKSSFRISSEDGKPT